MTIQIFTASAERSKLWGGACAEGVEKSLERRFAYTVGWGGGITTRRATTHKVQCSFRLLQCGVPVQVDSCSR